jgi:L-fuconolactonase
MRLDAHQHFWKYSAREYAWIDEGMGALKRDFLPQDLHPLLNANGFDGCISVQARQDLEETKWLLELAGQNDFIKGVVGWVDLRSGELHAQLDGLAGHKKLVGVRHIVQAEPDDEFMLRADFRDGISQLRERGLTYDLLLYPRHLPAAVKMVSQFPDQKFVLDHIAKPGIAAGLLAPWERDIRELAKLDNVWCKISGMVTEAKWNAWKTADFLPYLDTVFEAFSPDRLMIGSDWPVCTLSADYAATMGIVKQYLEHLPVDSQDKVLGGNCARFYGLECLHN